MLSKHAKPRSIFDLFCAFSLIGLQGFGGVLPIVQHELVEKKCWVTKEEFIDEWTVAQALPGPNVVNLSLMLGARYFGLCGAIMALSGLMLMPLIIVLSLGVLYSQFAMHPGVAGAVRGMSAVAAGLIIATGIKLFAGLKSNPLGKIMCIALGVVCFVCIALLHLSLLLVLLVLGPLACWSAYRALKE